MTPLGILKCIGVNTEELVMSNNSGLTMFEDFWKNDKRYEVPLLWKEIVDLSDNYAVATKHWHTLIKSAIHALSS